LTRAQRFISIKANTFSETTARDPALPGRYTPALRKATVAHPTPSSGTPHRAPFHRATGQTSEPPAYSLMSTPHRPELAGPAAGVMTGPSPDGRPAVRGVTLASRR